ncbi:hypothetical protein [Delftia phage PhiW-14]|uniref:Uncharacterized protein n=1 Tax=Delftia phage PhiW-14 TaxID=665032 RepID=C9DGH5_BPW14|nr:hypothetical protein DP-phiW-14_gp205 [Delftia phage PhiW-14]ACV50226.1 hypothetical protein [Delftia phage PhiW-14]
MSATDNKDGRLGGDNALPGQLPLVECVINVDMAKVQNLTKAGDVQALATYLKSLITESISNQTVGALQALAEGKNPFAKEGDDDGDDDKDKGDPDGKGDDDDDAGKGKNKDENPDD